MKYLISLFLVLMLTMMVFSQESTPEATPEVTPEATENATDASCPALVAQAIDLTQRSCSTTGTNEACYGFTRIDAEFRSLDAVFNQRGDIEDLIDIQTLQLSPLDVASGQWGVAVLSVEPNTQQQAVDPVEDDVQIILYGDTTLSDVTQFVEVTAIDNVNIREFPRTDSAIIESLEEGEIAIANGRLEDDSWFRIRLTGDSEITIGWIRADFLTPGFDTEALPQVTTEETELLPDDLATRYGPMQAFIFESGQDDSPCEEAPESGMLIQTPEGAASVTLWLDEVVIQLDGTGRISAQADGNLSLDVIEGVAEVEANGQTSTAVAGQAIDVELDENLSAVSVPSAPRASDPDDLSALPVGLLNDPVNVPAVSNTPLLATASGGFGWTFSLNSPPPYICSDGSEVAFQSAGVGASVSIEADSIVISGVRFTGGSGVYTAVYSDASGNLFQDTIQIISSDRISGERVIDLSNPICTITLDFTLQFGS